MGTGSAAEWPRSTLPDGSARSPPILAHASGQRALTVDPARRISRRSWCPSRIEDHRRSRALGGIRPGRQCRDPGVLRRPQSFRPGSLTWIPPRVPHCVGEVSDQREAVLRKRPGTPDPMARQPAEQADPYARLLIRGRLLVPSGGTLPEETMARGGLRYERVPTGWPQSRPSRRGHDQGNGHRTHS